MRINRTMRLVLGRVSCGVCGSCGRADHAGYKVLILILFSIVYMVWEKTGVADTSTFSLISPNAASMRGMKQIGLVAVTPVFSTTLLYGQVGEQRC